MKFIDLPAHYSKTLGQDFQYRLQGVVKTTGVFPCLSKYPADRRIKCGRIICILNMSTHYVSVC